MVSTNTKVIASKADWGKHLSLATKLFNKLDENGKHVHTSQTIVPSLKAINYTVNGFKYEGTRVSAMVAGMESLANEVQPVPVVEPLVDAVHLINDGLTNGSLKYTKTKLVHKPKVTS